MTVFEAAARRLMNFRLYRIDGLPDYQDAEERASDMKKLTSIIMSVLAEVDHRNQAEFSIAITRSINLIEEHLLDCVTYLEVRAEELREAEHAATEIRSM